MIAPDYRGAGHTSRPRRDEGVPDDPRGPDLPRAGYDKWSMAEDVHELLHEHPELTRPALVLRHDIGAMLAVAYGLRYRADVRALGAGEAPVPGTSVYERLRGDVRMFHFNFHTVLGLPEAVVRGREREYLQHFYDKLGVRPETVDTDHYVAAFAAPGPDTRDNRTALDRDGRITVPVLAMTGASGPFVDEVDAMTRELAEDVNLAIVPDAAHWIAEENPGGLVAAARDFDHREEEPAELPGPGDPSRRGWSSPFRRR